MDFLCVILVVQDTGEGYHLVEEHNILSEAFIRVASCPRYLTIRSYMFNCLFQVFANLHSVTGLKTIQNCFQVYFFFCQKSGINQSGR